MDNLKIYKTEDATQFKKLEGNRDMRSVKKIIKSINSVGYVLSPILVNEKMEVIDGQNRLEACKELGLPIYYMMQYGLGLEECRALNIGQSNWNTEDYIRSYASTGNQSYIWLLRLWTEYKKDFGGEAVIMASNPKMITDNGNVNTDAIRKGKYSIVQAQFERAGAILSSMRKMGYKQFAQEHEMYSRTFYGAVIYAFLHQEVNAKELIERMNANPLAIVSCSRTEDQLKYFDEVWNKGRRGDKKVFMSTDFQRKLYID